MKNLKKLLPTLALTFTATAFSFGQSMVDESKISQCDKDMSQAVSNDLKLTSYQMSEIDELDVQFESDVEKLKVKYEINSAVYLNNLRLLNEKHDLAIRNVMTLEQYALYLNNHRDMQFYDSEVETEEASLERNAEGYVYYEDETGSIEIEDDKFIIDNEEADTYFKVTPRKIKYIDNENDRKVKIKNDKVVIVEDGTKKVIEDDEAEFESEFVEIEIENTEM